jgi:hypothetical protein
MDEVKIPEATRLARQHLSRLAEILLAEETGPEGLELIKKLTASLVSNPDMRRNLAFLIRDYCADHLRPEVKRFAGLMEMKLLKHDPALGQQWKDKEPVDVFSHINDLMNELEVAISNNRRIGLKAADVANHAMILADLAGELESV